MHQAGVRNTVGLTGTAPTEEQIGELARLAPMVALALDADGAGQEAMLSAARVAAGRNLALHIVPLPQGADGAELVQSEGAKAVQQRVEASVPFVRFRVERELDAGDLSTAEGKDRVIDALRPVFAGIPPSAMREELFALVADRTDLAPALVASRLARPGRGRPASPSPAARSPTSGRLPACPAGAPTLDPAARGTRAPRAARRLLTRRPRGPREPGP
jgi:DNA primase